MNVITCISWVKKGVATSTPDKVELTPEELENIIKQTQSELQDLENESDNDEEAGTSESSFKSNKKQKENTDKMDEDEYNFDKYDDETDNIHCHIGGIAVSNENGKDPYITVPDSDDDFEKEDDIIKPDDNLVLVGHVDGDASILEVFVHNESEGSFYCHHDILLPAFPLCIEWLDFDPSDGKPGNLCAIGSMSPIIDVWDLDIIDCLEPAFKLGRKSNKKKKVKGFGHKDAVLDITWNENFTHVLASGSVDRTVLLWDLENGKPVTKLSSFNEKVQCIKWFPKESSTLLTGCADKFVRLFDCTAENIFKSWQTSGEVEKVVWDYSSPNMCYVGTSVGTIECIDIRKENELLWQQNIDEKEITGLSTSALCPGMLVSTSASGTVHVWDITDVKTLNKVYEENTNLGSLQCLAGNSDNPFIFCVGGDNKAHNLRVFNFLEMPALQQSFKNEFTSFKNDIEKKEVQDKAMDVTEDLQNLAVALNSENSKNGTTNKKKNTTKRQ